MVGDCYTVDTNEGVKVVKSNCCSCCFNLSMKLPCRHILALRKHLGMDMFFTSLCDVRWHLAYYRQHCRLFSDNYSSATITSQTLVSRKKKESQRERFRTAQLTTNKIADLASEVTDGQFNHRMLMLKEIIDIWGNGGDVSIQRIHDPVSDTNNVIGSASDVTLNSISPALNDSDKFSCNVPSESGSTGNVGSACGISSHSCAKSALNIIVDPSNVPLGTYSIDNVGSASDVMLHRPVRSATEETNLINSPSEHINNVIQPPVNLGIRMPPRFKPCGRPKGIDVTVVGLRKKRGAKNDDLKPFSKLHISTKKKLILTSLNIAK